MRAEFGHSRSNGMNMSWSPIITECLGPASTPLHDVGYHAEIDRCRSDGASVKYDDPPEKLEPRVPRSKSSELTRIDRMPATSR